MPTIPRGSIKSNSQIKRTQNFYQINKAHKLKIQPHKKTIFPKKKKNVDQSQKERVPIFEEGGSSPCPKGAATCRHGGALAGCDWPSRACHHRCYQQNHRRRKGQLWNWKRMKSGDERRVGGLDRRSWGWSPTERGRASKDSSLSLSLRDCFCFPVKLQTNGEIQSNLVLSSFRGVFFFFFCLLLLLLYSIPGTGQWKRRKFPWSLTPVNTGWFIIVIIIIIIFRVKYFIIYEGFNFFFFF